MGFDIGKLRNNMISLKNYDDRIVIRSFFGGKKAISKNDINVINNAIFSRTYNVKDFGEQKILKDKPNYNRIDDNIFTSNYQILSVQGFWSSGASAALDILREFDNVTSIGGKFEVGTCNRDLLPDYSFEVEFYRDLEMFNLYKLSYLKSSIDFETIVKVDARIKSLILKANKRFDELQTATGINFIEKFNKFILNIVELNNGSIKNISQPLPFRSVLEKEPNLIKTNEGIMYYSIKDGISCDFIVEKTREFIASIFNEIKLNGFLALDQFLATYKGYDLDFHKYYVGNVKQIVVYRDIRDQFMDNLIHSEYVNFYLPTINDFLYEPEKLLSLLKNYSKNHSNRLILQFESLVNDYENSVDKICNFLDIDKSHHVNKFRHFRPEVSRKNIGIYKNFHDQSIMEEIYKNFKEYCYEG